MEPISLRNLKMQPLHKRENKVFIKDFGMPHTSGSILTSLIDSLPDMLASKDLKVLLDKLTIAVKNKKQVIITTGAHTIKLGLSPIIIDLMKRGILTGIALNGAGIIHDAEIAMIGATSEDVDKVIADGTFGMVEETGKFLNNAICQGVKREEGLGYAIGKSILDANFIYNKYSILANAVKLNIPITVHVAIGTDIIHFHPDVDGAAIGKASHTDFLIFSNMISQLEGGVYINLGSAVILPEVFLKAISLVRNLGYDLKDFTTVDMDFVKRYRPQTNVVKRPTKNGLSFVGHNEIMLPLITAALIERLEMENV